MSDNPEYLEMFSKLWDRYDNTDGYLEYIVETVLSQESLWNMNLNDIEGLKELVTRYLISIEREGIEIAMKEVL